MKRCDTHAEVGALAPCSRCGRHYCDPCLSALIEGRVACEGCRGAEEAKGGRPWGFAAVVLAACGLGAFGLARTELRHSGQPSWALYGLAGVFALAFAGFIVSRKHATLRVERREPGDVTEEAGMPYRQVGRVVKKPRLPPVSGRLTAFTLLMCLAFSALAAPFATHLPRWVEAEIVCGASWVVWTAVLTSILYRGGKVADDHRFEPSLWFAKPTAPRPPGSRGKKVKPAKRSWFDGIGDIGSIGDAGEGCVILIGALLLAGAAVLTAWLLVELVIPALFTLAYLLLIRALKVATNDDVGCAGDLARSVRRGALFATLFVGPLLVLVALVHLVARKSF